MLKFNSCFVAVFPSGMVSAPVGQKSLNLDKFVVYSALSTNFKMLFFLSTIHCTEC